MLVLVFVFKVVTTACVSLSFFLSVYKSVCVEGDIRETTALCVYVNNVLENKQLKEKRMLPLFVIFQLHMTIYLKNSNSIYI